MLVAVFYTLYSWRAYVERDRYMAPEEAKTWGLVDHIYSDRGQLEMPAPSLPPV